MEEASGTHCVSPEENDSVVVQTEPSSSHAGENSSGAEADNSSDPLAKSSDVLAKGLSSMLSTVIRDFDSRAQQTLMSQHHLSSTIDRLTGELDQLLEDAPLPFIMQHAAKISSVRKRVSSLNSLLKSIQGRIDNMDRMLSIGTTHVTNTNR
ncbi:Snapin/Pallidin/Snn1 [Sesbania bispinosa]|nr:Snapin/Pallidin/Snn1 [Sesbania bispinosa]